MLKILHDFNAETIRIRINLVQRNTQLETKIYPACTKLSWTCILGPIESKCAQTYFWYLDRVDIFVPDYKIRTRMAQIRYYIERAYLLQIFFKLSCEGVQCSRRISYLTIISSNTVVLPNINDTIFWYPNHGTNLPSVCFLPKYRWFV